MRMAETFGKKKMLLLINLVLSLFGLFCDGSSMAEQIIDLTWDFDNNTVYWEGVKRFGYTKQVAEIKQDGSWYAMNEFCAGEHGGTHLDAPYHFNKKGWKVGQIPIHRLIVPGATFDGRYLVHQYGPDAQILPTDLQAWELLNGKFPKRGVLLINFGWSDKYPNRTLYFGEDERGILHFPGLSVAAAEWLVNHTNLVGVGVDTPSIDRGNSEHFEVHQLLAKKQIYGLENLKIPADMLVKKFTLFIFPMKLASGTGAPLRIVAIPNEGYDPVSRKFVSGAAFHLPFLSHVVYTFSLLVITVMVLDDIYYRFIS